MLSQLFSKMGFAWAKKWKAQADLPTLEGWQKFLQTPDVSLEEADYRAVENFYTERMRSEWIREYRKLRNKFARRAIDVALVEHAKTLGYKLSNSQQAIAEREGLDLQMKRITLDPVMEETEADEVLEFTPGRKFDEPKFSDQITN